MTQDRRTKTKHAEQHKNTGGCDNWPFRQNVRHQCLRTNAARHSDEAGAYPSGISSFGSEYGAVGGKFGTFGPRYPLSGQHYPSASCWSRRSLDSPCLKKCGGLQRFRSCDRARHRRAGYVRIPSGSRLASSVISARSTRLAPMPIATTAQTPRWNVWNDQS